MRVRVRIAFVLAAALAMCVPATASAAPPGPKLRTPTATMAKALTCPSEFVHTERQPVLLVHGTQVTPQEHWGWNYLEALPRLGFDVCTVTLPGRSRGDIQASTEYVVHAIRAIAERSGRRVDIIGHSQGALQPRWAMRWWPDIAPKVDDLVSISAPNHGTDSADHLCGTGECFPSAWQFRHGAAFLAALNSNKAPDVARGVSGTSIYSETDELVQPSKDARLLNGVNIRVQDICPGRVVEHVEAAVDAVVFALAVDALTAKGGARTAAGAGACTQTYIPGLTPFDVAAGMTRMMGNITLAMATAKDNRTTEPPLEAYARS